VLLLVWLSVSLSAHGSSRTKDDVVYMKNGDKITGEIQSLAQGQLSVKPDYASSSIVLDWNQVDHVESKQQFVIIDPNGLVYSGTLSGKRNELVVTAEQSTTLVPENVIEIDQLGTTFLKRLRGDADLGMSFARSNGQKNLTLQTDLGYQSTEYVFALNTMSQFSSQEKTNDTNETTVKTQLFKQLRESKWYAGGLANFLSSSEQQIDLRSTLGGAFARRQIFTNRTNLNFVGGLGYTNEKDAENSTSTSQSNSIDGAFAAQYSTFRFDSTTFNTSLWVYPSITSAGRVRFTLNQDVYYKFLKDFYLRMSFYDNYDNRPNVGTPSNNLGATTTVGWSFH